ncbi:hypothetical protein BGX26_009320, partial [Mortierella sp. AD094]
MIVPGSGIGKDLDRFVQKDSRWIIDVMGGKGYEVLTSPVDAERLALHKELDRLQNKCDRFFHNGINTNGFGSNWHTSGLALAHSLYYNMTLYPSDKDKYFIGMTTCTETEMRRAFTQHPPETDFNKWNASPINFESTGEDIDYLMWQTKIIKPEFEDK